MARHRSPARRGYERTDRVGELVREIVASELERIGDERLELVTVTGVDVDGALERADVFYSAMSADEDGRSDEVVEALEDRRWKIQQRVNREVRARRTPQIRFRPDETLAGALRIDEILRGLSEESQASEGNPAVDPEDAGAAGDPAVPDPSGGPDDPDSTRR